MGLVAPQHVGPSWTRARTHVPCIGRWILNHCATREAPVPLLFCGCRAKTLRSCRKCPQGMSTFDEHVYSRAVYLYAYNSLYRLSYNNLEFLLSFQISDTLKGIFYCIKLCYIILFIVFRWRVNLTNPVCCFWKSETTV